MLFSNPIFQLSSYHFNPYSIAPILVAVLVLIFGFFLQNLERNSEFNRASFYFCASAALWLSSIAVVLNSSTEVIASFWMHFLYAGFAIMPATVYHLSVNFTNRYQSQKIVVFIQYVVATALVALCRQPYFIAGAVEYDFGFYPFAGPWQPLLIIFISLSCALSFANFLTYYSAIGKDPLERERMRLFIFSFFVMLFSFMDVVATYNYYIYPSGFIGFLGFMTGITFFKLMFYQSKMERHAQELEVEVEAKTRKLSEAVDELQKTQFKLVETGKKSALASLSAGILHQISQPITAIHGFVRFMKKEMSAKDKFYKPICHIEEQSIYIKQMLEDLMNLVRHREIKKENVDVNGLIDRAINLLSDELRIRRVAWELDLGKDLPKVHADPVHLQQIFMNMVINALYSFDDLPIGKLRMINVCSKFNQNKDEIHVSFEDSGPKLSEEDKEIIFEPFFSTKAKQSGVGLALCQDLMAEHEGKIEIGSNTDSGRTFILRFPITAAAGATS